MENPPKICRSCSEGEISWVFHIYVTNVVSSSFAFFLQRYDWAHDRKPWWHCGKTATSKSRKDRRKAHHPPRQVGTFERNAPELEVGKAHLKTDIINIHKLSVHKLVVIVIIIITTIIIITITITVISSVPQSWQQFIWSFQPIPHVLAYRDHYAMWPGKMTGLLPTPQLHGR